MLRSQGVVNVRSAISATAVMANNDTIFTVGGGPVAIVHVQSLCIAANDVTASTLQYRSNPTVGTATTFSGASASLASFAAGGTVTLNKTALTTAPDLVVAGSGGVSLGANVANNIIVQAGTIQIVIGIGSTTGTWRHHIAYIPLAPGATVS